MYKNLVIVESPTKERTIKKILGSEFIIVSSMGHLIDLPAKKLGVDIETDFKPTYTVIPSRKKILSQIKKLSKSLKNIFLATDPDREGEVIGWHIKQQINSGRKYFRVIFHEITPAAIKEAFAHPQDIDQNLVNAQQARRILDRLVGYYLSPLLWKKIARGLSAGRVQSVALRIIVEREREIEKFVPKEYWEIEAQLKKKKPEIRVQKLEKKVFIAKLDKIDDQKIEIKGREQAETIVKDLQEKKFIVSDIQEKKKNRYAPAPFITSTMQQEAFNKLKFITRRTMIIAQQLYEGIELGEEGPVGLITYMRTDSTKVAHSAIKEVRDHILYFYGKDYLPETPNIYKVKKSAQEAHEAIRPTSVKRTPSTIKKFLTSEQFKLYDLIYKRFVASQMTPAKYLQTTVTISAGKYQFSAAGSKLLFGGFTAVYDIPDEEKKKKELPKLTNGEELDLVKLTPSQHFTKPPPRYSESSLVKALEEDGIGRPSTYAPIIQTIVVRGYTRRVRGYFYATELGAKVTDMLVEFFPKIMDLKFTATMEEELDEIEEGKLDSVKVLKDFYGPFAENLNYAQNNIRKVVVYSDQVCQKCGKQMVEKWGRRGKFLSCSDFPKCKFSKSITTGIKCPQPDCTGELIERHSRRGSFYGCTKFPKCRYTTDKLPEIQEK